MSIQSLTATTRRVMSAMSRMDGQEDSRLRMQTIIRLRWFGVGGQLITLAGVYWLLGYDFPVGWCIGFVSLSAWLNVYLRIRFPARYRLTRTFATILLAWDILELAALLYLTGGLQNPFAFLLVAPVTVSAATLPARNTILLGAVALIASALLVGWHLPLPWTEGQPVALPVVYKLGMLASIASGMAFLALYAARLSKEARLMSEALAATEHVLAREQKLHALDGLAAAAAHELGTPLATIALVTKELERSSVQWPELQDDITLLRTQAERCRDILRKLTRSPTEQDPHHVSLPVTQLLQEAAGPYTSSEVRIRISSMPRPAATSVPHREPIGERRPGLIYGLGNLVENAVDFAGSAVDVSATWDEREIEVTVTDDGPGFAPDIIDTLGEPYVTTRTSGNRLGRSGKEASGLGLGFFIAKTLLERSGAHVSLENRPSPDHGAIVRVTWPRSNFDLPDRRAEAPYDALAGSVHYAAE
ncbi:MAG: ActS/PrrB/RegB family redox-sensitive histidine kinase [Hyphomicrobiaceae bacterium]